MSPHQFALFDTAIGRCGIGWSEGGVAAVQLPEATDVRTRARLLRRLPDAVEAAPTGEALQAVSAIVALLGGKKIDLSEVPLDWSGVPPFERGVYEAAREIPAGETCSYGEIAARMGAGGAARDVGQALGRNPFAIIVPCHRVTAAGGKLGGFSANRGVKAKLRILAIEGARLSSGPTLFDEDPAFRTLTPPT